jgi:hypothetical protein
MEYSGAALSANKQQPQGDTMSDSNAAGFGKFVPGFDFLQNLAKGATASVPQMPNLGSWVAPTLNVEELDKRIEELKNVQFWLEQNSRALSATIQALEVQRMTLATLKGMNFNLGDLAKAFQPKAAASDTSSTRRASEQAAEKAAEQAAQMAAEDAAEASQAAAPEAKASDQAGAGGAGLVDPLQLWGSLTQQFQQIAASALKDVPMRRSIWARAWPPAWPSRP